jgi:hypothetical protein
VVDLDEVDEEVLEVDFKEDLLSIVFVPIVVIKKSIN